MKITQRQLRQIIREELTREMQEPGPPNLRLAEDLDMSCGTCAAFCPRTGTCKAYGGVPVLADQVCNAWMEPQS